MNPRHSLVAARAGHRCEYCRAPEGLFNFPFEVEHILPLARGGRDEEANWALACRSCNVRKAASIEGRDPETAAPTRLFHPRIDSWGEHFRAEAETGELIGLSPIGRATVERLAMNSAFQVAARRQWMRLGLFP